jgi:hypothetical protein
MRTIPIKQKQKHLIFPDFLDQLNQIHMILAKKYVPVTHKTKTERMSLWM